MNDFRPINSQTPLPSIEEARGLWDRFCMLANIRAHSEVVCRVALTLTDWLEQAGVELYRPAVEVGALLHDIAKTTCLGTSKLHTQVGQNMLQELGFPELGLLVAYHVILPEGHPLDEIMVVNYADKRVTHDQIVSLRERYDYILERYGEGHESRLERIHQGYERAQEVEQTIFSRLEPKRRPEDIFRLQEADR